MKRNGIIFHRPSMLTMIRKCVFLFSFFILLPGFAQAQNLTELSDSALYSKIEEKEDSSQIKYLIEIADRLQSIYEDDSSAQFITKAFQISEKFDFHRYDQQLYALKSTYLEYARQDYPGMLQSLRNSFASSKKYGDKQDQVNALRHLNRGFSRAGETDSAIFYAQKLRNLAEKIKDTASIYNAISNSIFYLAQAEKEEAANSMFNQMIELAHKAKSKKSKAAAFESLADSYQSLDQPAQGLYYLLKATDLYRELGMLEKEYNGLTWIAVLYENANNYKKGIEYSRKALALISNNLDIAEKYPGVIADQYNNMGWAFWKYGHSDSAFVYFKKSKNQYLKEASNDLGLAYPLGNLGLVYTKEGMYDSAIYYSNLAKELFEKQEDHGGVGEAEINIGMAKYHQGKYAEALASAQAGLESTQGIDEPQQLLDAYWALFKINKALKNFPASISWIEKYTHLNDSINNTDDLLASQKAGTQLAQDKDAAIIDALETKSQLDAANLRQQKIINYSIACFALLILISLVFIFRNWKAKKKAYAKLNKQHEELVQSKKEIEKNHAEIALQKDQIEMQHEDIIASINFASRIQQALLKPEDHVNKKIPKHFIYYQPRDIVSGDFYWAVIRDSYLYLSVADCTGHGVPGAMMSMLGIAFLNEIMAESKFLEPHEIMNRLRDKITHELGQKNDSDSHYRDGMDMSMVRLDLDKKQLLFAGANNPLWLYRNGEIIAYKGQKQAVCYSETMVPFESTNIDLQKDDVFYLFSDGYPDQFGGEKGKKLMYKHFRNILEEMADQPMARQKENLAQKFQLWKGDQEQVDDICVLGLRI